MMFLKHAVLPAIFMTSCVYAETLGITGGGSNIGSAPAYAALVTTPNVAIPISLGLPTGKIDSVAINVSGQGIVGGQNQSGSAPAYAALISPSGIATSLSLNLSNGVINSVAINDSGSAIVGGQDLSGSTPAYTALISPSGTVTPISLGLTNGAIKSVAINGSNEAIIGGEDNTGSLPAYAARISSVGALTPISLGLSNGIIQSVAINSSNIGLIGGEDNTGAFPGYAAFVSPSGIATPLSLGLPSGRLFSVAINDSSQGIVGGENFSGSTPPYTALISPSGTVTPLDLGIATGAIVTVSINSSGYAVIGGQNVSGPLTAYAAFISPSGTVTPISLGITTGLISSVDINDFNQALIGGRTTTAPYLAIFSPSTGAITIPTGLTNGFINSVAILSKIPTATLSGNNAKFAAYINQNAPQNAFYFVPAFIDGTLAEALASAAPTRNAIALYTASNNLFYLNHSLSNYLRNNSHIRNRAPSNRAAEIAVSSTGLRADELTASMNEIAWQGSFKKEKPPVPPLAPTPPPKNRPYTLWFEGIGALSYQKAQKQTVGFHPTTGAALLGFDAAIHQDGRVGGGFAYSYTHIHEKKDAGHSHINQEYLFVYGTYQGYRLYVDAALWGGLFQIDQVRKIHMTGFNFQSTSSPHGGQLAPHVELGYNVIDTDKLIVDPFVMVDWISAWQNSYKEKGSGPFNAEQKDHYSSFLRTEAGVRVYETISFDSWRLTFQEKGSYVYKKPFSVGRINAFLIGSPGSFTVATLTTPQNLGVAEFAMIFEPIDQRYPYGTITYQGEFGSSSQSHQVSLELAWNF